MCDGSASGSVEMQDLTSHHLLTVWADLLMHGQNHHLPPPPPPPAVLQRFSVIHVFFKLRAMITRNSSE